MKKKLNAAILTVTFAAMSSALYAMPESCARAGAAAINGWQWLYYGAKCVTDLAGWPDPFNW
jgi:hypothetical protein